MRIAANDVPKPVITDDQIDTHDEDLINEMEAEKEEHIVEMEQVDTNIENIEEEQNEVMYQLPEDIKKIEQLRTILRSCK